MDHDPAVFPGRGQGDRAVAGTERLRIVQNVPENLGQAAFDAVDHQRPLIGGYIRQPDLGPRLMGVLVQIRQHRQHGAHVHRPGFGPGQFGIQARGIGNVADQPVQPDHVFLNDGHQFALLVGVFQTRRGFNGASKRGQGVLDFMGHIGGEAFDGVHAFPERLGHVLEAFRQVADFIVAAGKIGDGLIAAVIPAHPFGGGGQAGDRPGDGARQVHRQQHRHGKRAAEDFQDIQANLQKRVVDGLGPPGQHQGAKHVFIALNRHGDAKDHPVPPGAQNGRRHFSRKRRHRLRIISGVLAGVLMVHLQGFLPDQAPHQPVIDFQYGGQHPAAARRWQFLNLNQASGAHQQPGIGNHDSVALEKTGPGSRRFDQPADDLIDDFRRQLLVRGIVGDDGPFPQGGGEHLRLDAQGLDFRVNQVPAVFIQVKKPGHQNSQRQHVDGQDAPGQRRKHPPPWAGSGLIP